mgnify:CR=1 FL=1
MELRFDFLFWVFVFEFENSLKITFSYDVLFFEEWYDNMDTTDHHELLRIYIECSTCNLSKISDYQNIHQNDCIFHYSSCFTPNFLQSGQGSKTSFNFSSLWRPHSKQCWNKFSNGRKSFFLHKWHFLICLITFYTVWLI